MSETRKHDTTPAPISTLKTAPSRRSMLTGSGALLAGVTGFLAAMPSAAAAAESLDAELIRICSEHIKNMDAYNNDESDNEAHKNALWDAYESTRDAIDDAKPQTVAGMLAKARAAKAEAVQPDGSEDPTNCPAENWSWDLLNDLFRLNGSSEMAQVAA
jgi:hypothetical protein